jgi:hypothetical protein
MHGIDVRILAGKSLGKSPLESLDIDEGILLNQTVENKGMNWIDLAQIWTKGRVL